VGAISGVIIRAEAVPDHSMIRQVNEAAFGCADEADLVEALRTEGVVMLSVVAELDRRIVGHILFSRMSIETPTEMVAAVALAPMAVLPRYQRQGIGGRLIRYGLDALRGLGERIVIVVGHPSYYPRFGFSAERARSLEGPFPPDAFMALELSPGALDRIRGRVRYPRSFGL
jgi:putative acetyltransferase